MNKAKKYEEPDYIKQKLNELIELLKTGTTAPLDIGKAMRKILFIVKKKYPSCETIDDNDYGIIGPDVIISYEKLKILELFINCYFITTTDLLKLMSGTHCKYDDEKIKLFLQNNIIVINEYLKNNDIDKLNLIFQKQICKNEDIYYMIIEFKIHIIDIFNKYYPEKITPYQIFQIFNLSNCK